MMSSRVSVRNVPFFNYPFLFKSRQEQFTQIFVDVCSRGAFILQRDCDEFEKNLAAFSNTKYALGVANGTDAIWLALMAAGLEKGDEVICTSHTYIATGGAIHFALGIPIPVDCKQDHMIDPDSVRAKITSKTRAIVPTQLNGRCCDMDAIMDIATQHNLFVVEDAAQGLGAKYKGKGVGSFDKGGTISFYPAKNLGSFGDAGGFITNDFETYEKVRLLRDHGRNEDGEFVMWGFNSRLDNLQAAILNYKLSYYQEEIDRRRAIATAYQDALGGIKELHLPPAPDSNEDYYDVYQNYEIEAQDRDDLKSYMKDHGIGSLVQWNGQPIHALEKLGYKGESLKYTDAMFKKCLMIPMNTSLSDDDVSYVCEKIINFYK